MIEEGKRLAGLNEHLVVKIPTTYEGLKAIAALSGEGIPVNATLVFSPSQALLVAKAGAAYCSPFVGRLDDVSHDGMELIEQAVTIYTGKVRRQLRSGHRGAGGQRAQPQPRGAGGLDGRRRGHHSRPR